MPPPAAPTPPSGGQVDLVHGDQHVVVTEVGGGLRLYTHGGRPVLDGFGIDEMCTGGRGQALLPWPNRVDGGRYRFGGTEHQLALSEPEHGNAIHGLTRWSNWDTAASGAGRALMSHVLHPQPGYPFTLGLTIEYVLSRSGLAVTTTATNLGTAALPFGAGFHPYLTVGTERVDDTVLQVPASAYREADARGIPTGTVMPVAGTELDFRRPRPVGDAVLDTYYTDLQADPDGLIRVRLSDPDGRAAVTVWAGSDHAELVVFTGDTLEERRRRRSLAVEPLTCPADAFRSGLRVLVLEPGRSFAARWGISPG